MFSLFAAHAAEGAILMFNAGDREGEAIGAYQGDPLFHASLDPADYDALLMKAGFELIEHSIGDFATGGRTFWLARASNAGRW